jgi:hypothetical protein
MLRKSALETISFFLLLCLLPLLTGCQFYGKRVIADGDSHVIEKGQTYAAKNYIFFIHVGSQSAQFSEVIFYRFEDKILGQLTEVDSAKVTSFKEMQSRSFVRYGGARKKDAKQVHIYAKGYTDLGDGKIEIRGGDIEKVDVYAINGLVTTLASLGVAAITYVASIAVFLIIFCSCPHVYTWDGDAFVFSSTLFTGAVHSELARGDYKLVPDFFPGSSTVRLQVRNEDYEVQYIDQLVLDAVVHANEQVAYVSQKGEYLLVEEEISPSTAMTSGGVSVVEGVEQKDDLYFDFDALDGGDFVSLEVGFDAPVDERHQLLVRLKNSKWGSMTYKEMTSFFGHRYDDWREKNVEKSKEEIVEWLDNQKLKLTVEQRIEGQWEPIEEIQMIGDEIFAEFFVNIRKDQPLEFRLTTGFKFWDLDYIALALDGTRPEDVSQVMPITAGGSQLLSHVDNSYHILAKKGQQLDVRFEELPVQSGKKRTLFLRSAGYYEANYTFEDRPRYAKLLPFRKPGSLSRYSKSLYQDYTSSFQVTTNADE